MIEDPPLLKIRRGFARPEAQVLAAFAGVPTGNVVDAMDGSGALAKAIKPLEAPFGPIVGTALTCRNRAGDNLGLFATLDVARPGDIVIAAADGFTDRAITGDMLCGMLRNVGVAALVTDASARDVAGILATGLPVYCDGISPNSPVRNGPGSVGYPVTIGGVNVASGDVVVADADGVVIVPREQASEVAARLREVLKAEAALQARVDAGLTIPDFIRPILASDRVVEE